MKILKDEKNRKYYVNKNGDKVYIIFNKTTKREEHFKFKESE